MTRDGDAQTDPAWWEHSSDEIRMLGQISLLAKVTFTYLVAKQNAAGIKDVDLSFEQRVVNLLSKDTVDTVNGCYLTGPDPKLHYFEHKLDSNKLTVEKSFSVFQSPEDFWKALE